MVISGHIYGKELVRLTRNYYHLRENVVLMTTLNALLLYFIMVHFQLHSSFCHFKHWSVLVFTLTHMHFHLRLLFIDRKQNMRICLRCPPISSVRRWQKKKQKMFGTICYLMPPPSPPSSSGCWKLWTVSRTHILAHSQVRRRLRSSVGPMAHGAAASCLRPLGQWRASPLLTWRLSVRSLSSQRSIPASAGITEDLTPAESDVRRPRHN